MKRIAVLGSTGSIGRNTLDVIRRFPKEFSAAALSANSNIGILSKQIKMFKPKTVCVNDETAAKSLACAFSLNGVKIFPGEEGLKRITADKNIDKVVLAISGSAALKPLLCAIDSGKEVALANKETLVMAGPIIMDKAKRKNIKIIPVDSEQSAIWQCLAGQDKSKLKTIYLTASGGPFRGFGKKDLKNVSLSQVLKHPRWKMGKKISVDSATLMNKGLELLEAMYLFDVSPDKIKIIIHPQAVIHSMVEFVDGSILAQLSITDMRIPIQYALSYPERLPNGLGGVDFCKLKSLSFQKPDFKKFPCLEFAYRAAYDGGTAPAVLNASNEACVGAFLQGKISFVGIPIVIGKVLSRHRNKLKPCLDDILEADNWARLETDKIL